MLAPQSSKFGSMGSGLWEETSIGDGSEHDARATKPRARIGNGIRV
jgi:hypothetical protein